MVGLEVPVRVLFTVLKFIKNVLKENHKYSTCTLDNFCKSKSPTNSPKKNLHFQFLILKNFCILYHCAIYGSSEIWLWSQRVYNVSRRWFPVFFRVIIFSGRCVVRVSPLWVSCTVSQIKTVLFWKQKGDPLECSILSKILNFLYVLIKYQMNR